MSAKDNQFLIKLPVIENVEWNHKWLRIVVDVVGGEKQLKKVAKLYDVLIARVVFIYCILTQKENTLHPFLVQQQFMREVLFHEDLSIFIHGN